jgi:hypothetical protein
MYRQERLAAKNFLGIFGSNMKQIFYVVCLLSLFGLLWLFASNWDHPWVNPPCTCGMTKNHECAPFDYPKAKKELN